VVSLDFSARRNEEFSVSLRFLEAHDIGFVGHRPGIGVAPSQRSNMVKIVALISRFATENDERGESAKQWYPHYLANIGFPKQRQYAISRHRIERDNM
jgi:hypothetical protein